MGAMIDRRWMFLLAGLLIVIMMPITLVASSDPVSRAEAWFDSISTMRADFIQVASDGTTATGELHLRRPHRMKVIYDLEEPLILLTTPVWLHVDRPNDKTPPRRPPRARSPRPPRRRARRRRRPASPRTGCSRPS